MIILIIIPLICFFCWYIFDIVIDFNILFGTIVSSICLMVFSSFLLVLFCNMLYSNIKEKSKKDFFQLLLFITLFTLSLVIASLNLVNGVRDCFEGTKKVTIVSYNITTLKRRRSGKRTYKLTGYDKEGNKYKLNSRDYISKYEDKIKITYYKNLEMIKSFKYINSYSYFFFKIHFTHSFLLYK